MNEQADYEAALAVVIDRTGRNASPAQVMSYVLGYMCSNDVTTVTARKRQVAGGNTLWGYGNSFDGFAAMDPWLVSARKVCDPSVVELRTELNENVMQKGRADDMIFSIAEIVSHLSQGTALGTGTVVLTGTPHGIGVSKESSVFLRHGDDVRIAMSRGLGSLVNRVVYKNAS